MARHSINAKKHHGGKVKMAAEGNLADTGTPITGAPKYQAPDVISTPRHPFNAPPLRPSSIPPATQLLSPMGEVLRQDGDPKGTLNAVIAGDVENDQLRSVSDQSLPIAGGMKRQQDPEFFSKKSAPTK
jgi:hypothetical protein